MTLYVAVGQDDAITKARHEESSIWFKSYTDDAISKDPPATTDADAKARREEASIWLEAYTEDASGKASSMESDSGIWLESYTNDAVAE